MAIKNYSFDYSDGDASASFQVDTDLFTSEMANDTLTFFSWDEPYDKNGHRIDEVMKKYALQAIWFATKNDHNTIGVTADFEDCEGYYPVDGSKGITLLEVDGNEIHAGRLEMEVS